MEMGADDEWVVMVVVVVVVDVLSSDEKRAVIGVRSGGGVMIDKCEWFLVMGGG